MRTSIPKINTKPAVAVFGLFLAAATLPLGSVTRDSASTPFVGAAQLETALASDAPMRLPGSDELDFFYARRAHRGGNDHLADRRILVTHQGRYQAYGAAADLDRAEALADSLTRARPTDPGPWASRAQIHLAKHEFRLAERAAVQAVRLAPPVDGDYYRLKLFDTRLASGKYDEAERTLGLARDRRAFGHIVRRARLADRKGDVGGARDLMEQALGLSEAYAQPALVRAWNLVELGHFEHHSGNTHKGVERYLEALEVAPGYPAALEALGWVAFGVDQNADAARELFTKSLANGGHLDIHLALAEVARFQEDHALAAEELGRVAGAAATDPAVARLMAGPLALAFADKGELDRAHTLSAEDLMERRTAESLAVHGWITHRLGQIVEAKELFAEALAWGQPEPLVYYLAGKAAAERADLKGARHLIRVALEAATELGPVAAKELREIETPLS